MCFGRVVGTEGGFTKDPNDKGNWTGGIVGKGTLKGTKYGISAMSYPKIDIQNLTLDQAKAIYQTDFWLKVKCDQLPVGVDYIAFDAAVNNGPEQSVKFIQTAVGAPSDGAIGPKTIAAVNNTNPESLVQEFGARRAAFYAGLSTFKTYGLGWLRRVMQTTTVAFSDVKGV